MNIKKFNNNDLGLSVDTFIDNKQNIYFKGKDVASALGYSNTKKALVNHVPDKNKIEYQNMNGVVKQDPFINIHPHTIFITESGLYRLVMKSNMPIAEKFQDWVVEDVIPTIRKYGYYRMFNNSNTLMFKMEDEYDLHTKVVQYIRRFYPKCLLIAGLGELQYTSTKRIDSYKKGYQKGQPDLIITNLHKYYNGFCIEFKTPKDNGIVSKAQKDLLDEYKYNGFKVMISNDYDLIIREVNSYMCNVRIKCIYCCGKFKSNTTLRNHIIGFHRIKI